MGRPPVAKDKAKSVFVGAFVTPPEAEQINKGITESGMSKSEWMRSALLSEATGGKIILRLRCPDCGNEVRKLPRHLKSGGATVCPKCGNTFIDQTVLKEAEAFAKFLQFVGA